MLYTKEESVQCHHANTSTPVFNVASPILSLTAQTTQTGTHPIKPAKTDTGLSQNESSPNEIVTPVKACILKQFLKGYDVAQKEFLVSGFTKGFHIQFEGPQQFRVSRNLLSASHNVEVLKAKLQKEISARRIAGPYNQPPFEFLQCSPIGLVPKKEPGEYRMIHHLSYPEGSSVNDFIPDKCCSVAYNTVDDAVNIIKQLGHGCLLAKTDVASAFRIVPIHPNDHKLLGMFFQGQYFYDRCLPMGCSISCSIFEKISKALQWIACEKFGVGKMLHVLDDFLFLGPPDSKICDLSLAQFISMCEVLGVPIKAEKTEGPSTVLTFLGIELDTIHMEARLPQVKVEKIRTVLGATRKRKKVTLRELQSLIGLLNHACCVVVPGRAYLRRLIDLTKGKTKPHHYIRLNKQARLDMHAWSNFMESFNGKSIFLDEVWENSVKLHLYTDASGSLGYGAICGTEWFYGQWADCSLEKHDITFKELFPITLAMEVWGSKFTNKCISFHSDNMAVVDIINKMSSKDVYVMILVRRLVLACLNNNILFQAKHIPGRLNILPDLLSRLQVERFKTLAPAMDPLPTSIPQQLLCL